MTTLDVAGNGQETPWGYGWGESKGEATMDKEDRTVLEDFAREYKGGVVVLRRKEKRATSARRVNVYVDGLLTVIDEDTLQRLMDIGWYIPVEP
jgi:hypothetical protein